MEMQVKQPSEVALNRRQAIMDLQGAIMASEQSVDPAAFPVLHHFAPGQYAREIFLPTGSLVVGKIHKEAHINVLSLGRVRVFTEHDGVLEIVAPATFVSKVGTKRAVLALEDTVWTTVHSTDKTDLAEIEKEIIAEDFTKVSTT